MNPNDLLLLRGDEVVELFRGRETEIIEAVRAAYLAHEQGDVSVPNCPFLRFPHNQANRIIPKPAFLGGGFRVAGLKWVASFPRNVERGMERASATLILNSTETGVPEAVMEGSVISAYRTAAAAALGADVLRGPTPAHTVGVLGCGPINFETLRFLLKVRPEVRTVLLLDLSRERALLYRRKCEEFCRGLEFEILDEAADLFGRADVVSIATTATTPHLGDLGRSRREDVILHTSLRDFTPEAVLAADNVVDDVEHVCSNRTSLELAEQLAGGRSFIRATIGEILAGRKPPRGGDGPAMFSPFGLGLLDLAVADLACRLAGEEKAGTVVSDFLPTVWTERRY
jgi:2,3-diaminopropionate biosynthesis protein SbnB